MAGEGPIEFQASPDVEIILKITRGQEVIDELKATVLMNGTVQELKESLAESLELEVHHIVVYKDDVELDDARTLMDYEISTDDTLTIQDTSP